MNSNLDDLNTELASLESEVNIIKDESEAKETLETLVNLSDSQIPRIY